MKKYLWVILSGVSYGASADITLPAPDDANSRTLAVSYYRMGRDDTTQRYSQDNDSQIYDNDLWLRDATWDSNSTIADGSTAYQIGENALTSTLYINHVLTGRLYEVAIQDAYGDVDGAPSTTVIGLDDPDESSVTGNSIDRSNSGQRVADAAVTIWQNDVDDNDVVGSWTFEEGNYFGGDEHHGIYMNYAGALTVYGTSFVAGDQTSADFAADGAHLTKLDGDLYISNRTDEATDRFQAGTFTTAETITGGGDYEGSETYEGGDGLSASDFIGTRSVTIYGGTFIGSVNEADSVRSIEYTDFDTYGAYMDASGGRGAYIADASGGVTISGGDYVGGDAGSVITGGDYSTAVSMGGEGAVLSGNGSTDISDATFTAGRSYGASVIEIGTWEIDDDGEYSEENASAVDAEAIALGAAGLRLYNNGTTVISNVTATGSAGSTATAYGETSNANATGGSGLLAESTDVTINSGTFTGGDGGLATTEGTGNAFGGAGATIMGGSLTINGGTFTGGDGGTVNGGSQLGGMGIWIEDADLTMTENVSDTLIDGHLYAYNSSSSDMNLFGGTIDGDIYLTGDGTTALTVSTNASYSGELQQYGGTVNVQLGSSDESRFFSSVYIGDSAEMNFNQHEVVTAEDSVFQLSTTNSRLYFDQGVSLSEGSGILANYGTVDVGNAGNLVLGQDAYLELDYNFMSDVRGSINVDGTLIATNSGATITLNGNVSTPEGSIQIVSASAVDVGTNGLEELVVTDLGWLVENSGTYVSGGIVRDYEYTSLTNSSLVDLDQDMLVLVDGVLSDTNQTSEDMFYAINSMGESDGTELFRYSLSQLPDVAASSLTVSREVNRQIAGRSTEYRSMNGFASSKPGFSRNDSPVGVAGPMGESKDMQGWIRAYGTLGETDSTGNFTGYDSSTVGTLVGVDKSFGRLLVGVAGGYASTDLDADTTYEASVDTYHGSLYSTLGGERTFLDLALTYGFAKAEESNLILDDSEFDANLFGAYLGGGMRFVPGDVVSLVPEASLLSTYYHQNAYSRSGDLIGGTAEIDGYDTWSHVSSLGISIASAHQLEWLNQGVAFIPEVRFHWLHEFNPEPDDFTYTLYNSAFSMAVRPRDEELFRIGTGVDIWSWKHVNSKFEIDYDGFFSESYAEHVFSGKYTYEF